MQLVPEKAPETEELGREVRAGPLCQDKELLNFTLWAQEAHEGNRKGGGSYKSPCETWLENWGGEKTSLPIALYSQSHANQALRAVPSLLWEKCLLFHVTWPRLMPHWLNNPPPSFRCDSPIKRFLFSYLPISVHTTNFSPFWRIVLQ